MKSLWRIAMLVVICWAGSSSEAHALCPGDEWGIKGSGNVKVGQTEVEMSGYININHSSAHTSSCVGTTNMILRLQNGAGELCMNGFYSPVTYNSPHGMNRTHSCPNLTRGHIYSTSAEFWWNYEEGDHQYDQSSGVWVLNDKDEDGYEEDVDCDEDRNDVWENCTDVDTDQWYAFEDCDDERPDLQEEVECLQAQCEEPAPYGQDLTWGPPCYTPILIGEDPLTSLTSADRGVPFDLGGAGKPHRVPWTRPDSRAGWLALDRNGNGQIDSGSELFGNMTAQPESHAKNGFLALATFDSNRDGWIDAADAIFPHLRVWRDANFDGVSQPEELQTLPIARVERIALDYKMTKKVDAHGNAFLYRARVVGGGGVARFAWDVILPTRLLKLSSQ